MQNAKIHQNQSAAPSKALAAVAKLQVLLVRAPTEAIAAYACATLVSIDTIKKANAFGLGSPYRQAYFLLGLLSTSPEPVESRDLTPSEYADLPRLLDAVFSAYTEEIFVHARDFRPLTADEERDIEIAGPEFIKHHMTGRLAVFERIEERIRRVFSPLDQKMRAAVGFTALEAIEIMKWIVDEVVRRLDEHCRFNDELRSAWKQWRATARNATSLAELESGPAFERAKAAAQAAHDTLRTMNAFSRSDLRARFGATGDAFLARFVSRRGDNPGFRSVTDRNPVRYAPLFAIDGEFVVLPLANALYEGVYDALVVAVPAVHDIARCESCPRGHPERDYHHRAEVTLLIRIGRALVARQGREISSSADWQLRPASYSTTITNTRWHTPTPLWDTRATAASCTVTAASSIRTTSRHTRRTTARRSAPSTESASRVDRRTCTVTFGAVTNRLAGRLATAKATGSIIILTVTVKATTISNTTD
jgi:hypothetical protein